ncbi:glycosyltransferase [Cellvibrio sp. NN19]|uniref:glycosyltransferase n=1 Tax=Cellvibrio chitinivorans TaxID=3102792 RepID=UPI002B401B3C|nr:glycosyltransferase [Cellvibrio sp. NN19]
MKNQQKYYYENLGPIFHYYIQKLDEYITFFDDNETAFLFCSRAGITINTLYDEFLSKKKLSKPENCHIFWTSRFILSKSFLLSKNPYAKKIMQGEHRNTKPENFINVISPNFNSDKISKETTPSDTTTFIECLIEQNSSVHELSKDLQKQGDEYKEYIDQLIKNKKRVIVIDSGWQGSIQDLLQEEYPELDIHGLYFGTIGTPQTDRKYHAKKYGLVFSAEIQENFRTLELDLPQKVFALHRHVIEDVLEPSFSSIEHLTKTSNGEFLPSNYDEIKKLIHTLKDSTRGVLEYLSEKAPEISRGELQEKFFSACNTLKTCICHPNAEDIKALGNLHRSFDFGKQGGMPILFPALNRHPADSAENRIANSLWSHAQIAIEYEDKDIVRKKQIELQKTTDPLPVPTGRVAIITRTKNRPILLKRAAESVVNQTYDNYIWVIVNDGGEESPVVDVIKSSGVHPSKVILVSNPISLGMEAASNRGISQSESDYIIIHDDDDSWKPEFLQRTVSFLESQTHAHYSGVITGTTYISEEIKTDGDVKIHAQRPYNDWVKTVHLAEMANGNFFAPIAFLFSRNIYEQLKGFDESLPVLGDWDFNLRFLAKSNIGVIPQALANYHHRDVNNNAGSNYSNSVIGGISKHQEYEPIVRNKYIRSIDQEYQCLSHLLSTGYASNTQRHLNHQVINSLENANTNNLQKQIFMANDAILGFLKIPGFSQCFDERYYLDKNPDLKEAMQNGIIQNLFWHFLNYGHNENRPYRINIEKIENSIQKMNKDKEKEECLKRLAHQLKDILLRDEGLFDREFYFAENPDVKLAHDNGLIKSPIEHFIDYGLFEGRPFQLRAPLPLKSENNDQDKNFQIRFLVEKNKRIFDEKYYLEANPDIKEAITNKSLKSGFHHFVTFGFNENRPYKLKIRR